MRKFIQSTLVTPTLVRTTNFVIMTIWMSRNLRLRGDSLWEIRQEYCIKTSSNICFGYLQFLKISKTYVLWENKNKTKSFLHIILSIKESLQQQIHFNNNIFGNKCHRCNEGSLYWDPHSFCTRSYNAFHKNDELDYRSPLFAKMYDAANKPLFCSIYC